MKILHIITNTELGGAQRVCIELCNAALADGNQVAVASMQGGYLWDALDSKVEKFFIKSMVKPISVKHDLKCLHELRKVVRRYKPDVLQLHSSKAGTLGRLAAFGTKTKVVYTVHGFDSIRLKHRIFLPLEKILQNWCHGIVGVSRYDETNLRSEKINRNVHTIYNGIALPKEKTMQFFEDLRSQKKKVVLAIARIAPPKDLQMFLDAASEFSNDYAFVWIGGSDKFTMEEIKKQYEIPSNVYLLGDVMEASSYVHYADLFVLFSNFEGLPMSIIEAMSNGKPVVASNVGGIPELVGTENGCLVKTKDDAVCAIKNIFALDGDSFAKMSRSSKEKYVANFSLEKMWSDYKNLYETLLKK